MFTEFMSILNELVIIIVSLISLCVYTYIQKKYSKKKDYLYTEVLDIILYLYLVLILL